MALIDSALNLINKQKKNLNAPDLPEDAAAARAVTLRSRASLVINVFAFFLAVNTWYAGHLNSIVLNNTIVASDVWNFYQAKSIKQTLFDLSAAHETDPVLKKKYQDTVTRYESDPTSGEGKKELLAKALGLEAERDLAKRRSPWIGYANTAYQLSIVLVSASILSLNVLMFWGSFAVAAVGLVLSLQGVMFLF